MAEAGQPAADGADELEAANAAFYEAFEALSLEAMDAVWVHSDEAWCIHPGSELITGWGPVRRSWAAIFANTEYLQFIVTDTVVRRVGGLGLVTCTENILSGQDDDTLGGAKAIATNVFTRPDDAWRMLAHHGSPVLRGAVEEG